MKLRSILILNLLVVFSFLSVNMNVYAQTSQKISIDKKKQTRGPAPKIAKKVEVKPAPVVVKPPVVKKPEPKRVVIQPKKINKPVVAKAKRSRFIKVMFQTPETGLEIEIDKKGFYVNRDAQLTIPLTPGKHLVYVKRNGQAITDPLELTVSQGQDVVDLSEYIEAFAFDNKNVEKVSINEVQQKPVEETKTIETVESNAPDEVRAVNNSVGLNIVAQNIDNIFERFNNPKKTDNVSLKDWLYVYQQTSQNELIPRFSKEKVNLWNKFAEGQVNLLQANYIQAINSFEGAVSISLILKDKLGGETPTPYYGLGLAYLANKDYNRAVESFLKSARIEPKFAMAYSRIGDAYKITGRGKEALSYYQSAYKYGYKTFESSLNLANSFKQYKSYYEASELYQTLGKEKPMPEIYINLGDCFVELERLSPAIDSYRRAIELDPKSAIAYSKLGSVFYEIKDFQLAIETWQKSLDLDIEGRFINRKKVAELIKKAKKRKR
jgi:tetratricopeptide (TPR) repeat protein